MLVITFSRMASQELRERVRSQLVAAERALADPAAVARRRLFLQSCATSARPSCTTAAPDRRRPRRLRRGDDRHHPPVLPAGAASLGVAGDRDAGATLVENLDELVVEVVDDLYLREYGATAEPPPSTGPPRYASPGPPSATPGELALAPPSPARRGGPGQLRRAVRAEMDRRKRRLGILSYDDLLSRLAAALEPADAPARERMRQRWRIVLVDEFQDTDPVQWACSNAPSTATPPWC